jgi:hypothetical protein
MKQIIDSKTYNTETATVICDASNDLWCRDFAYERSCLYVTKNGAYFLAGEGGPASRFFRDTGNGKAGDSGIVVLTKSEALAEAEQHADTHEIEEFFADIITEA